MWKALETPKVSEELIFKELRRVRIKKLFPQTKTNKIFETNSSLHVKWCTTGKP